MPRRPPQSDGGVGLVCSGGLPLLDSAFAAAPIEALAAIENEGIAATGRSTDRFEVVADERQDLTTSLNFPLHWTSAFQSWGYLFDIGIACELLAPRPDDLVLDLAAGTCWATELLHRVGVRTVSMDLSVEMLQRGRQRLAFDGRLVFRDEARFIAGRGQQLPFASETFDGVLCMNALHHMPSYVAALREIHRVLKEGGRAVFSEPGTAHAQQPLSQTRMREEMVIEKPVSLPMIRRYAHEVGFSRMTIVPLRAARAYAVDYTGMDEDVQALLRMWDETLRFGPHEYARFVLHKGEVLPQDTLLAADRLVGKLKADIDVTSGPRHVTAGTRFSLALFITNSGAVTWRARGRRFGGQVSVGIQVCNSEGTVLRDDLGRTALPRDVAPGESLELECMVAEAPPPGRYILRCDMVVEGVTWFGPQGSPVISLPLEVRSV